MKPLHDRGIISREELLDKMKKGSGVDDKIQGMNEIIPL